jgi:hypothetical protein
MPLNSSAANTGRNVALATALVGLIGAAAPVFANLDLSSTAGIVAGLVALSAVAVKYLEGWQRYEARLDGVPQSPPGGAPPAPVEQPPEPADAPAVAVAQGEGDALADAEEPPAPAPGETLALGPDGDDEPADIPFPPTDDEIDDVDTADTTIVAERPPARHGVDNARVPTYR